ncbi:glycosyltransferase, partial [Acidiphilium sp.]
MSATGWPVTVSVVVPFHNEAENVVPLFDRLAAVLDGLDEDWELVCVNDGSRDATLAALQRIAARDGRV